MIYPINDEGTKSQKQIIMGRNSNLKELANQVHHGTSAHGHIEAKAVKKKEKLVDCFVQG